MKNRSGYTIHDTRRSSEQGFTLLEVIIYVTLVAALAIFLSGTITTLLRGRGVTNTQAEVHDALRLVEEKIGQDIRGASAVTTPATAGATASTLVMTVGGSTITYDLSSGIVRRKVDAGAPAAMTPTTISVSALNFTRLENTNAPLGKTVISIQSALTAGSSSNSPDKAYTESKQFTTTMP